MGNKLVLKEVEFEKYTGEEIAFAIASAASQMNFSYACWRLPNVNALNVLVDFSIETNKKKAILENTEKGFVLQSFVQKDKFDTIFLTASIYFSSQTKELIEKKSSENNELKELFLKRVIDTLKSKSFGIKLFDSDVTIASNAEEHYKKLIGKAKKAIQENRFKKIVLARSKQIENNSLEITIFPIIKSLIDGFPNALVSLVYSKETGTWLTASPEVLASIDSDGIFKTIALAGTQLLNPGDTIQKASWSQKEIEEQALVSRYIINCFKKIRLREYEEEGPRTVQSGNLLHLRTDYSVNTKEVNFPELGTVMLELLHPTSAVCGMPKEVTLEFINEHEGLDRKLFSGYLGPINIDGASNIFVNLRCANLFADKAVLYAGAGVTQDSEPEKEFLETELKMEAVGNFLRSL